MFYAFSKTTKAILSVIFFSLSYILLTLFFDITKIYIIQQTPFAFLSLLPHFWFIKLPLSFIFVLCIVWINFNPKLNIKSKTVGDGQHGTARFGTEEEKYKSCLRVPFGKEKTPGIVVGVEQKAWLIDTSDTNALLLASPGGGKTKTMLIPTIYYNAKVQKNTNQGASMLLTDCKGEELRTTANMLKEHDYNVLFLDFRHPLQSYCFNLMIEVNRYMDKYKAATTEEQKLIYYARAEKFAKMVANAIIDNLGSSNKDEASEFFKDTSQGLLSALILLVSEYGDEGERHIVSVFKLIIELNGLTEDSSDTLQKNKLKSLLDKVNNERIKSFAGASITADVRTSMNIFSSALSKLLAFIDAELEQLVCRHSEEINDIDFVSKPTAIFLICPDEDKTRHFFASLFIRYFVTALITQAEENGGELQREVIALWDEMGQMPAIKDIDSIFTAFRSRKGRFLIALQSYAQLEETYGKSKAKIIKEACQILMFTNISPNSKETLTELSEVLGKQTVLSGSVTMKNQNVTQDSSSYQMVGKPLMSITDIITLPKFDWVLQKSSCYPIKTHLPLYWDYLKKYDPYEATIKTDIIPIQSLTSEKISQLEKRKQSKLSIGMFD
ncbi:type IV secretory system conjugative DNA transfer family protein [Paludicola sp. MB14-C6]|uniref:type IV secretory system conjugative DNA transfer family protein n=1 Tax=Paludihabitans sp. MB14-C6 TaxID=3070656 RepID=UPI0027DCE966|nr:type IV secretory system conjugative DNA transfer family protein [Paludicola sp. MB14-C6]WMJ22683.1 type IV secretory system conjugative DNA transfer family protein [Paludicola sp. MB14-C6]